ncbi:MAG: lipoyl(octanoyl) transferase LipB [Bacteroidetes bacterium]|nr:lipoyl(octanoyl) transferase LipB [Bacteroidota bacterium]
MDYKPCWDLQESLFGAMVKAKIARRNAGLAVDEPGPSGVVLENDTPNLGLPTSHMLLVEHPHVLTLGKSGEATNVVASPERLAQLGVQYHPINRGGDITYHGPGQLVGYPILDLDQFFTDIHKYLRTLEEAVIRTCADWGVIAGRIDGLTGVWVEPESGANARKICAFGVKCSRWVTMHGLALNVDTDLAFFELIVPCGIADRGVTSLSKEVGHPVDMDAVKDRLIHHLGELFGWEVMLA